MDTREGWDPQRQTSINTHTFFLSEESQSRETSTANNPQFLNVYESNLPNFINGRSIDLEWLNSNRNDPILELNIPFNFEFPDFEFSDPSSSVPFQSATEIPQLLYVSPKALHRDVPEPQPAIHPPVPSYNPAVDASKMPNYVPENDPMSQHIKAFGDISS
jgi:hypothetical protein